MCHTYWKWPQLAFRPSIMFSFLGGYQSWSNVANASSCLFMKSLIWVHDYVSSIHLFKQHWPMVERKITSIHVEVIHAWSLSLRLMTYEMKTSKIIMKSHASKVIFNVIPSLSNPNILILNYFTQSIRELTHTQNLRFEIVKCKVPLKVGWWKSWLLNFHSKMKMKINKLKWMNAKKNYCLHREEQNTLFMWTMGFHACYKMRRCVFNIFPRKIALQQHGNTRIFLNIKIINKVFKKRTSTIWFHNWVKELPNPSLHPFTNFTSHNDLVAPLGIHYWSKSFEIPKV